MPKCCILLLCSIFVKNVAKWPAPRSNTFRCGPGSPKSHHVHCSASKVPAGFDGCVEHVWSPEGTHLHDELWNLVLQMVQAPLKGLGKVVKQIGDVVLPAIILKICHSPSFSLSQNGKWAQQQQIQFQFSLEMTSGVSMVTMHRRCLANSIRSFRSF